MSYLRLKRAKLILSVFVGSSLLLFAIPSIDIGISRLFFDAGFHPGRLWWANWLYAGLGPVVCLSMVAALGVYIHNRFAKRNVLGLDGKRLSYLLVVLVLGAGLVVNVVFKDHFGRARPRDVAEFGGAKHFTPPFVVSNQCHRNCSFSSGHAAGAFLTLAFAMALGRRRATFLAALGFGSLVSLSRIAAGAHFFSDCLVSFFVMLIASDVFYYYMIAPNADFFEPRLLPAVPLPAGRVALGAERIAVAVVRESA